MRCVFFVLPAGDSGQVAEVLGVLADGQDIPRSVTYGYVWRDDERAMSTIVTTVGAIAIASLARVRMFNAWSMMRCSCCLT